MKHYAERPLSIDEQVALLRQRGLNFADENKALEALLADNAPAEGVYMTDALNETVLEKLEAALEDFTDSMSSLVGVARALKELTGEDIFSQMMK